MNKTQIEYNGFVNTVFSLNSLVSSLRISRVLGLDIASSEEYFSRCVLCLSSLGIIIGALHYAAFAIKSSTLHSTLKNNTKYQLVNDIGLQEFSTSFSKIVHSHQVDKCLGFVAALGL
ncbi:MAG: hypothetical protein MHPSP_002734, partial [Paramarteilia canceri]